MTALALLIAPKPYAGPGCVVTWVSRADSMCWSDPSCDAPWCRAGRVDCTGGCAVNPGAPTLCELLLRLIDTWLGLVLALRAADPLVSITADLAGVVVEVVIVAAAQ